jgi:hypothetical protein
MTFRPGESGNPGGRPAADPEVREAARKYSREAIEILAKWMRGDDARSSVAACNALLDRAYGKPTQAITGPDGDNEIRITIRNIADEISRVTVGPRPCARTGEVST